MEYHGRGWKTKLGRLFPVLRKVDPQGIRRRMTIYFGNMIELFDSLINKRLLTRKVPGSTRNNDMLDTLLDISEESTGEIDKTQIERLFLDLFIAGNDTTSATLEWTMAELIHNPEGGPVIQVSDSEDEVDRSFVVRSSNLIVARANSSSVEEDEMPLNNKKKGLCDLLKARGLCPKGASGSQPLTSLPLPSPPINVFALAGLKKRKKDKDGIEEGELVPQKDGVPPPKQKKVTKGKGRASSVESRADQTVAKVHL
ncbi:hypothetical protein CMV_021226 [Castanea mollissima]|uniref:Cytochrome P450 n=1 Tax=Castanea mollissima TaxID=60419 RepID=A0A8J4QK65_9ROSI|nr:hypothetical protein CMV_021226 [Castanea mollissima]